MKPLYQKIIEIIIAAAAVFTGGLALYDSVTKAFGLITFRIAIGITLTTAMLYLGLMFLFSKHKVRWVTKSGVGLKLKSVGKKTSYSFMTAVIIVWIAASINYFKQKANAQIVPSVSTKVTRPIFSARDRRFKVLIMPFEKFCEYDGGSYDIGRVIHKRLISLSNEDSLDMQVEYLNDSSFLSKLDAELADSVMKHYGADQIIYGFYSLKQCEAGDSAKICFNYRMDPKKWSVDLNDSKSNYKIASFGGIESLYKGTGQEDIDFIIYSIAGISELYKHNYLTAIKRFKKIPHFQENESITLNIAVCYNALHDYKNSSIFIEQTLKLQPCNTEALWGKSYILFRQRKYSAIEKVCSESLKCSPLNSKTWAGLAACHFAQNKYQEGFREIAKSISIDSNTGQAWYTLGNYYYQRKSFDSAKMMFKRATIIESNAAIYWHELGVAFSQLDSLTDAIQCALKAHDLEPNYELSLFLLGKLCFQSGDYQSSKQYYEQGLAIDSLEDEAWIALGTTNAFGLQNSNDAIINYEKAIKLNPRYYLPYMNLGVVYLNLRNNVPLATNYFKKALSLNPGDPQANFNMACVYSISKNKNKALFHLSKAIATDENLKARAYSGNDFVWLRSDADFMKLTQK
jgi:tetratricopeptide (TPR) repeat protein